MANKIKKTLNKNLKSGFTLIEIVVTVAIFTALAISAYGLYMSVTKAITYYRTQMTISSLANQYLEIARNLAYSKVGTVRGSPNGSLPDSTSPWGVDFGSEHYEIYYVVTPLHDESDPNETVQNYKQVKLYVKNSTTGTSKSFVTTIAPIDLGQMIDGGALSMHVIDQTWQDVSGATINIVNTSLEPEINLTRTTNSSGRWTEVGLPADSHYHITVTKDGYSADQTYSVATYPDTTAPDATVIDGEPTQKTFIIDKLSHLSLAVKNQTCQPISGANINVAGAKTISPGVPKFDEDYSSDGAGAITPTTTASCSDTCNSASCCLEWDTYTPTMADNSYMIYGTSPIQEVSILPDTTQNFSLILGTKTTNSLLAVVTDATTGNPIEGATVLLKNTSITPEYEETTGYTGGSIWSQNAWYGGSGQTTFTDSTKYFDDDGNITTDVVPQALRLEETGGVYASSGYLISSTFDTGTSLTSFSTITWQEGFPDPDTTIAFQIATSDTNDENTEWNFIGPGGTSNASDVYDVSGTSISSANNNKRYVRYKVYLSATNTAKTPVLSSVNINYVSGCPTPGQVIFTDILTADGNYTASVSKSGYETQGYDVLKDLSIDGYFILQVQLVPSS